MNNTVLFIDGENFMHKVNDVMHRHKLDATTVDVTKINLQNLISSATKDIAIGRKIFYAARLHEHKDTKEKSKELIKAQRSLKTSLEKQGFEFVIAGNVRAQMVTADHKSTVIFREKGVDVRIAVDLVALACDNQLDTAILCSSDSDLQPAVAELRKREMTVVYLGFETNPNKGLAYTTNRTILFRDAEILDALNLQKNS